MGIYNRDYIRDSSGSTSFGGGAASGHIVCKRLVIVTIAVFIGQMMTVPSRMPDVPKDPSVVNEPVQPDSDTRPIGPGVVTEWLALDLHSFLFQGQIWRIVTYAFCHSPGSIFHILFNMLFLWWFGKTLESMYGSREFLFFYLTAAVISGLCFLGIGMVTVLAPVIGASGAIMAIVMVYAMHFPRHKVFLMGIIPIEIRWLVVFYVVSDLWPVLQALSGDGASDGIAHSAHLGGLAFGFLYKQSGWRLTQLFSRIHLPGFTRRTGSRRKIKIYQPSSEKSREQLNAQVDAILEKISEQGEASLTDREREILKSASQKYRNN